MKVVWLSAGVSSFVAGYLADNVDEYIYIDVEDQHPVFRIQGGDYAGIGDSRLGALQNSSHPFRRILIKESLVSSSRHKLANRYTLILTKEILSVSLYSI